MEEKIEQIRELMIKTALEKGLGASETIELSKDLDELINQYDLYGKNYSKCITSEPRNSSIDHMKF